MSESTYIINLDSGERVEFDNKSYVLSRFGCEAVGATHHRYKGADQIGEHLYGSTVDTRSLTLEGYILADGAAALASLKRHLARTADPCTSFGIVRVIGGDEFQLTCRADGGVLYSRDPVYTRAGAAKFTLKATAFEPYFTKPSPITVSGGRYTGSLHFPYSVTAAGSVMGRLENSGVTLVENGGDLPCGCVIRACPSADVEWIKIENAVTHEYLKVTHGASDGVISAGEVIEINTRYGEKAVSSVKDGVRVNIMHRLDALSTFFSLRPGKDYYTRTSDTDGAEITLEFEFSPLYMID